MLNNYRDCSSHKESPQTSVVPKTELVPRHLHCFPSCLCLYFSTSVSSCCCLHACFLMQFCVFKDRDLFSSSSYSSGPGATFRTLKESVSVSVGRKHVGFSDAVKKKKKRNCLKQYVLNSPVKPWKTHMDLGDDHKPLTPGIHFKVTLVVGRLYLLPMLEN